MNEVGPPRSRDFSDEAIEHLRRGILSWGCANYVPFPWRNTDNVWHCLVAEMMLQRTRAEQVVPAYEAFAARYPNPEEYLLDHDSRVFASLGLHWREPLLRKMAAVLSRDGIPSDKRSLMALPGVGDYVASAVASLHLGQRELLIDGNVVRLYGRYFGCPTDGETRRKLWVRELTERLTPKQEFREYNYAMLDFTRSLCGRAPICQECPIRTACAYAISSHSSSERTSKQVPLARH